jgi:hypothetical protein
MDDPLKSGDAAPAATSPQKPGARHGGIFIQLALGWLILDACIWTLAAFHPFTGNSPFIVLFYVGILSLIGIPILLILALAAFVGEPNPKRSDGVPAPAVRPSNVIGAVLLIIVIAFFLYIVYGLYYAMSHFIG